jgi:hypothetical protein
MTLQTGLQLPVKRCYNSMESSQKDFNAVPRVKAEIVIVTHPIAIPV